MKTIAAAFAAILFASLFWSSPAEARCWWNGYRWHCSHYRHYYSYRHHYRPYVYYRPAYYPYYYRPYYCFPVWPFCG